MLTPAAKKRRVDAAAATLKKPFRSPLIKRPQQDGTPATAGDTATPLKHVEEARNGTASAPSKNTQASPERVHKRVKPHTTARSHRQDSSTELSKLLSAFEKELDNTAAQLRHDEDVANQAERIRQQSEKERPGKEIDIELKELIEKWKGASRLAAEEIFGFVKDRVKQEGGTKAWKEMQRRQREYFSGPDPYHARETNGEGENNTESQEGDETNERDLSQTKGDGVPEDDEEVEEEFTILMMLQSLHIDPAILGYDETGDCWRE